MEARILILGELVIGQRSLWECSRAKGTLVWGLSAGLDSKVESLVINYGEKRVSLLLKHVPYLFS